MTARSAAKAILTTVTVLGVTAAGLTIIVALAGFAGPAAVIGVSVVVATIILLSSVTYFVISEIVLRQKLRSHESKHAT
jgi:hypothetical protein